MAAMPSFVPVNRSGALSSGLFPPLAPYASEMLPVGHGHVLYVEQCGRPDGIPLLFLHGGPGSGASARHRQFFDPRRFRAVLWDQRGCQRSLPRAGLQHNDTDALVADCERLRQHLGIERWLVMGGSWGAGLALAYAAAHPEACLGLLLRSVFLGRSSDVDWFFAGAARQLPEAWQALAHRVQGLPQPLHWQPNRATGQSVLQALHAGVNGPDPARALACSLAWEAWEQSLIERRTVAERTLGAGEEAERMCNRYRIQAHYLVHQVFREGAGLLPAGTPLQGLQGLPTAIIHGCQDWLCQPEAALELHRLLPQSRLQWVPEGDHNPFDPGQLAASMGALAHFARHGHFEGWGMCDDTGAGA